MDEVAYSKYRWVVIAALCGVQAVAVAVLVAPATLIGEISRSMGLNPGETIAVTMVSREVFVMLSALAGGPLIDRFGPYRVWIGGSALITFGSFLVPVCGSNLFGMLAIRAVQGIGAGPIMATAPLVVAQWAPSHQRGVIIGIQSTSVSLGAAGSMLLVPFVFQESGSWQMAMAAVGIFVCIALIVSILVLFGPKPPFAGENHVSPGKPSGAGHEGRKSIRLTATWAAAICCFCFGWAIRIIYDIIPSYLAIDRPTGLGLGQMNTGKIISGLHISSIAAALLSGILAERYFRGRPRGLVMIGFILCAFLWLFVGFPGLLAPNLMLTLCIWAGGFAVSLTSPLVLTFVSKCYPKHMMGKVSGLITGFSAFGTLAGLALGSYLLNLTGMYEAVIFLISIGAFLGFLSAFFLREPVLDG